jgi:hypothetical protein
LTFILQPHNRQGLELDLICQLSAREQGQLLVNRKQQSAQERPQFISANQYWTYPKLRYASYLGACGVHKPAP